MIRKRVIIKIFIGICIVLLGCYSYVQYLVFKSLNLQIPTNTTAIIRVNNFSFFRHLLFEKGFHFNTEKHKLSDSGIEFPWNFIGYSIPTVGNEMFYFPLKIADERMFVDYMKSKKCLYSSSQSTVYQIKNKTVFIVRFDDQIFAILNLSRQNYSKKWLDAYLNAKFEKLSKSKFATIKKSNALLSLRTSTNFRLDIDIRDGKLIGNAQIPNLNTEKSSNIYTIDTSYALDFWANNNAIADISNQLPLFKKMKDLDLLHVFWKNNISKLEKQIDYTTDENFNVVAKTTEKKVVVPCIKMDLFSKDAIAQYQELLSAGVISNDTITKDYFTFWKFYSHLDSSKNIIHFSNDSVATKAIENYNEKDRQSAVLALNINFQHPNIQAIVPANYWKMVAPFDCFSLIGNIQDHSLYMNFSLPLKNKNAKTYSNYFSIFSSMWD